MKPLELTVYPLDPAFPAGYKLPRDSRVTYRAANRMAVEKRLTPSEMCAEYWASSWREVYPGCSEEVQRVSARRAVILHRFATLPHAIEETP